MTMAIEKADNAAWGSDDPLGAALADTGTAIGKIAKDDYSGEIKPPLTNALTKLRAVRSLQWQAADDAHEQLSASAAALEGAADAAASSIAPYGWGSPQDLEGARTEARNGVFRLAEQRVAEAVLSKRESPLQTAANAAQAALIAASKEVDHCAAEWSAPAALFDDSLTVVDLQRIAAIGRDIRTRPRPMTYAIDLLGQLVSSGTDAKKMMLFTDAAREVATEFRDTEPMKLLRRFSTEQQEQITNERNQAFVLLQALDQVRDMSRPASIVAGIRIVGAMGALFNEIAGYAPRNMSGPEFAARYLNGDDGIKAQNKFEIANGFPARWLSPNSATGGPPGWSPLVWTGSSYVRKATLRSA